MERLNDEARREREQRAAAERRRANETVIANMRLGKRFKKGSDGSGGFGGPSPATQYLARILKDVPRGREGNVIYNHYWVR